ncbi:MAG: hydrolase, partial [Acetobacteraceae bacterium]
YGFITGGRPRTIAIAAEQRPVLTGKVSAFEAGAPTNIAIAGANVTIFEVSPDTGERHGEAVHTKTTAADGLWGDFAADPKAAYEFVLTIEGYPNTHIYRSPFPRSSTIVDLRPQPLIDADRSAGAVIIMSRPRGYFGVGRDNILLGGQTPTDIAPGVPNVSTTRRVVGLDAGPIRGVFNDEAITARPWSARENHVSVIELTY